MTDDIRGDWLSPPVNGRYGPRGPAVLAHTLWQASEKARLQREHATRKATRRARWSRLLYPWRGHGRG